MKLELLLLFVLIALFLTTIGLLAYVAINMATEGSKCLQDPINYTMQHNPQAICGCMTVPHFK